MKYSFPFIVQINVLYWLTFALFVPKNPSGLQVHVCISLQLQRASPISLTLQETFNSPT